MYKSHRVLLCYQIFGPKFNTFKSRNNFCFNLALLFLCFTNVSAVSEPPQFIKEPEKHITAEMEKVVDIPCQARGESSLVLQ